MKNRHLLVSIAVMTMTASAVSQSLAQATQPAEFKAGMPLDVMRDGKHTPIS